MRKAAVRTGVIRTGELAFSVESRLLRELGERLVRQPEVALLELVKNAYDADAGTCRVTIRGNDGIDIADDGIGMTLEDFSNGWMRIGTGLKGKLANSRRYGRPITGEKGIGRFAVRYLGEKLHLVSTAFDRDRAAMTRLEATFDWIEFDRQEDLGSVKVPFELSWAGGATEPGTTLSIGSLKPTVAAIDWKALRTGAMGVVSPIRSLMRDVGTGPKTDEDPGFSLIAAAGDLDMELNMADAILARYELKADVRVADGRMRIEVFAAGHDEAHLAIEDEFSTGVGEVQADIRFFPRRPGLFSGAAVDGRRAYTWVRENSGVRVFDRNFQMRPYGTSGDDWLRLNMDAARNAREPTSELMRKHYPMDPEVKGNTALNWMLRLPEDKQLIGVVQVRGRRDADGGLPSLVAAADREGFIENAAFAQLRDLIRGAVEAIAFADREISLDQARKESERQAATARTETLDAIRAIEADKSLTMPQRVHIVQILEEAQDRTERERSGSKEREQQLETMSLLGVVAGFMTHEFGTALSELRAARRELHELSAEHPSLAARVTAFDGHIDALRAFVTYSRAYVQSTRAPTGKPYMAKPRMMHVVKAFTRYAEKRRIETIIEVERDVEAPRVPPSLYDGIVQNLFTNSLKALTRSGTADRRIALRAWNEAGWHHIQVSDTGDGIPDPIRKLVFDPLFTTTGSENVDPLGSGMGLGLALVRRGAAAFGGKADLAPPPPTFATCVEVKFPVGEGNRS